MNPTENAFVAFLLLICAAWTVGVWLYHEWAMRKMRRRLAFATRKVLHVIMDPMRAGDPNRRITLTETEETHEHPIRTGDA